MDYSSFPFPAQQNYFSCVMLSTFFPRIFNNNQSNHSHNLSGNLSLVSPSLSSNNYVSQQPSHQGHKGHHRNDSEIQMISVSKTTLNMASMVLWKYAESQLVKTMIYQKLGLSNDIFYHIHNTSNRLFTKVTICIHNLTQYSGPSPAGVIIEDWVRLGLISNKKPFGLMAWFLVKKCFGDKQFW